MNTDSGSYGWVELDHKVGCTLWSYLRLHLGREPHPVHLWETATFPGYALTVVGHTPSDCPLLRCESTWDTDEAGLRVNERSRFWIAARP